MLVIRLLRIGKKNQPSFKLVVVEKIRSSTSGRFIEEVGFYNPLTKEKVLRGDRIKYWLSVGVKPLGTVHNLLVSEKIIEGKKIPKHKKPRRKAPKESPEGERVPNGAGKLPTGQAKKKEEPAPASTTEASAEKKKKEYSSPKAGQEEKPKEAS